MADALKDTIQQNAQGPTEASVDGVSTRQHSLPEQIAADTYLGAKRAAATNPAKAFSRDEHRSSQAHPATNRARWEAWVAAGLLPLESRHAATSCRLHLWGLIHLRSLKVSTKYINTLH